MKDLNLLHALDALLQEGSVTRAAARAHITVPAMSRALGRIRAELSDPVLVRAGRSLVLTDYANSIREEVARTTRTADALLSPGAAASLREVRRPLVIRSVDAVAAMLLGPLHRLAATEAPRLQIRFVPEGEEDASPLRDGRVDLDIGVCDLSEPELETRVLLRDRFVGVVRKTHTLAKAPVTLNRLVAHPHVSSSRAGKARGPIDAALHEHGLQREVAAVVGSFYATLFAVLDSDLVAAVPRTLAEHAARFLPIALFKIPLALPEVPISQTWHPRVDAEPAHRWLRRSVSKLVARHRQPASKLAESRTRAAS